MVHIANMGIDMRVDLTTVSLPSYDNMDDIPHSHLSMRSVIQMKCSIFGFVVPIGKPS